MFIFWQSKCTLISIQTVTENIRRDMPNYLMPIEKKTGRILFVLVSLLLLGLAVPHSGYALKSDRESPVVRAVRKIGPAVVNISSSYEVRKRANPFSGFGMNPFFEEFFKDQPGFRRDHRRQTGLYPHQRACHRKDRQD
jgi:S1-C subfamily serine protease